MTFGEIAPGIVVAGYLLVVVICVVRSKLVLKKVAEPVSQFPQAPPTEVTADRQPPDATGTEESKPPKSARDITGDVLLWAAWLVGIGTTVCWIGFALGWSAVLITLGILAGIVVVGLAIGMVGMTIKDHKEEKETTSPGKDESSTDSDARAAKVAISGYGLILAACFWFSMLQPLLYLAGLTRKFQLHVSEAIANNNDVTARSDGLGSVRGYYLADGARHHVDMLWFGWGRIPGDTTTVEVGIAPLWPAQVFADASGAWAMLGIGAFVAALFGVLLYIMLRSLNKERSTARAAA